MTLEEAIAYARTYWHHGTEPETQAALTVLAAFAATALEDGPVDTARRRA